MPTLLGTRGIGWAMVHSADPATANVGLMWGGKGELCHFPEEFRALTFNSSTLFGGERREVRMN